MQCKFVHVSYSQYMCIALHSKCPASWTWQLQLDIRFVLDRIQVAQPPFTVTALVNDVCYFLFNVNQLCLHAESVSDKASKEGQNSLPTHVRRTGRMRIMSFFS